jgi:hypothetical protein
MLASPVTLLRSETTITDIVGLDRRHRKDPMPSRPSASTDRNINKHVGGRDPAAATQ